MENNTFWGLEGADYEKEVKGMCRVYSRVMR